MNTIADGEGAFSRDNAKAREAIQSMKNRSDHVGLLKAMREAPLPQTRIAAVEALGETDSLEAAEEMITYLESRNFEVVEGGSEQQAEHKALRKALTESICDILQLSAPEDLSETNVASFVSLSRVKLENLKNEPEATAD